MAALDPRASPRFAHRRSLLLAGAGALATGCASSPAPTPTPAPPIVVPSEPVTLAVTVVARDDVNPDVRGRPSPLAVRIMELRTTSGFDVADFFSLYERDQATLGPELMAREQFVLQPGGTQGYTRKANGETRFLGVLAAYRDLERSVWRVAAPIAGPAPPVGRGPSGAAAVRMQRVQITLERAAARIEVGPAT